MREQIISEQDLQAIIDAYQRKKIGDDQLALVFGKLAAGAMAHPSYRFDHPNPESVVLEAADLCLNKVDRYVNRRDRSKGLAVNYFLTIIGCYLRQSHRRQINLRKLQGLK